MPPKRLAKEDYSVGWICALPVPELRASRLAFDEEHENVALENNTVHQYVYGHISGHNVVVGCLPATQMGKASAASVATEMCATFTQLKITLVVGVGGGVPAPNDIRLGDVVISYPDLARQHGGVVQYDFGKAIHDGSFVKTGQLNQPPNSLLSAIGKVSSDPARVANFSRHLKVYEHDQYWKRPAHDHLFSSSYNHVEGQKTCDSCDPKQEELRDPRTSDTPYIHYGLIASGDQVMKDAAKRDAISREYDGILCFEMEAAGIANNLPCLVIRGICDYCDSHKNKVWQPFAAAAAAAWARELLHNVAPTRPQGMKSPDGQCIRRQVIHKDFAIGLDVVLRQQQREKGERAWLQRFAGQLTRTYGSVDDVHKLIDRMSSYEPRRVLDRISHRRLHGTTEWLMKDQGFIEWQSTSTSRNVLWLSGKVGSGKTFAISTAIEHLVAKFQSDGRTKVLHYFFDYPHDEALDLFRTLSKQLLEDCIASGRQCSSKLVHDLETYFGDRNRKPDLDELVKYVLLPLTSDVDSLVIAVDGIDASDEGQQKYTWSGLCSLLEYRTSINKSTKILITSENESAIATFLPQDALRVRLEQNSNSQDIEMYVNARIGEKAGKRQLFHDRTLRDSVKNVLLRQASNMFLWVHLQLEEILCCETPSEVLSALEDLPKSLSDIFMRCLKRKSHGKLLCRPQVLKWCSAARIPLRVDDLRDMLAIDRETGHVDAMNRLDAESVIRSGVSLLTLDEANMMLLPAHRSIRKFLFSEEICSGLAEDIDFPPPMRKQLAMPMIYAQRDIGRYCLHHIKTITGLDVQMAPGRIEVPQLTGMMPTWMQKSLGLGRRKALPTIPIPHPRPTTRQGTAHFLNYAIKAWACHTTQFNKTLPAWEHFQDVALQPNVSWGLHPWPAVGMTRISHLRGLLGYAVAQNHPPLLQLLVDRPRSLPERVYDEVLPGNELLPALHAAAKFGHVNLLPMLLKLCSVNSLCPQYRQTALHVAISHGQKDFASALCRHQDTDVNKLDGESAHAIGLAMKCGSVQILKSLIESRRVDDISNLGKRLTPLELDTYIEYEKLFLGKGQANFNLSKGYGRTLLHRAAENNEKGVTKLLLSADRIDINPKDNRNWIPLHVATFKGCNEIAKLLIDAGADINLRNMDESKSSLFDASVGRHEEMVELLLDSAL